MIKKTLDKKFLSEYIFNLYCNEVLKSYIFPLFEAYRDNYEFATIRKSWKQLNKSS